MIAALLLLGLVLTAAIIAANGYFVAQEFAYMSVDRARLRSRAESGDAAAARALAVTKRTSFMLSGAQLGITVTGLLVGYVAEPFIGESLGILLGGVGVSTAAGIAIGTVVALVLATVVQMIFGELFPKNLAIANPEPLARALARSTQVYLGVFGWLIALFDHASNAVLRLLRVEPVHDVDSSATAEDLEHIIGDSRASGDLPEELSILLDRILDFPDQDVEHAMVPRVRVDVVDPATAVSELRAMMAAGHTRYPVLGERDEPIGVVHLADVLAADPRDPRPASAIMRPPLVVPTLMPLPDALEQLTRTRNELACVIDEYGGFAGVVTIEDLAEELVGEISDEHDTPIGVGAVLDERGAWVMDGDMHLDEVERIIGRPLPRGDYETIAGLLIAVGGSLPELGEVVEVDLPATGADLADDEPETRRLRVEVSEVDLHVPSVVRVEITEPEQRDAADEEAER
ncbi:hemolysin family protein [Agromyces arachidis]|uniref:hemolysin family protein n=1 Tax=Agromyces arachidis TaxID=766966 RepID=UPI0040563D25